MGTVFSSERSVTPYHKAEGHSSIPFMERGQVCDVISHDLFTAVCIGRDLCSCDGCQDGEAASEVSESEERRMFSL